MHRDFVEALEGDRFEDLSEGGRILLKWLKELRCVAVNSFVNTVVDLLSISGSTAHCWALAAFSAS
jgi:hypothetical protein